MNEAIQTIRVLRSNGVILRAEGDRLRFSPKTLTVEAVAALKSNKADIIRLLTSYSIPNGWTPESWRDRLRYLARVCTQKVRAHELADWADCVDAIFVVSLDCDTKQTEWPFEIPLPQLGEK